MAPSLSSTPGKPQSVGSQPKSSGISSLIDKSINFFTVNPGKITGSITNTPLRLAGVLDIDTVKLPAINDIEVLYNDVAIPYVLERFNDSTGEFAIHYNTLSDPISVGDIIKIIIGHENNPSVRENPSGTFPASEYGCALVCREDPKLGNILDSTDNGNDGIPVGNNNESRTDGPNGFGYALNLLIHSGKSTTGLTIPDDETLRAITSLRFSVWVLLEDIGFAPVAYSPDIWRKESDQPVDPSFSYLFRLSGQAPTQLNAFPRGRLRNPTTSFNVQATTNVGVPQIWHHVEYEWDGTDFIIYVDAVEENRTAVTTTLITSVGTDVEIGIGGESDDLIAIIGMMEFSKTHLFSTNQRVAKYESQRDPVGFYTHSF